MTASPVDVVVATAPGPPVASDRLPVGFRVRLSTRTRRARALEGGLLLVGGTRGTVLRLSAVAAARLPGRVLRVRDAVDARLARSLLDTGMADPVVEPSAGPLADAVTVVVPAYDDAAGVAALLDRVPAGVPVVVVDDASPDPGALRRVVEGRAGARLLRHDVNAGPAAARNTGLLAVRTPAVCFCDADVVPPDQDGWLRGLLAHLDDPAVGLVAPRVTAPPPVPGEREGLVAAYERARSSLDLGALPAGVRPGAAVAYLPSACLLARTAAVADGFRTSMRVAEDVDLVWRSVASGWRARYDPDVEVAHRHRTSPVAWVRRKAFYGTGAALLAREHGAAVAPAVLAPWTVVLTGVLLAQRRWSAPAALGVLAVTTHRLSRRLPQARHPHLVAARLVASGVVATAHQSAASATRHHWPVALAACLVSRRARRAVALAAVGEALVERRRTRARLDPVRWTVARRLDDLAYGAGVWAGAWRARSPRALLPRRARGPG